MKLLKTVANSTLIACFAAASTTATAGAFGIAYFSEWAPQEQSVLQTVSSATQDADPAVRISALQTLGQGAFRFDDVRDAIVTRLQDPQEDLQVRTAAWRALETFPLEEPTYLAYVEFGQAHPAQ